MAEHSKIEWTDASWTPIRARNLTTGKIGWHCEHATTGCEFCYAEGMNKRLGTGLPFKPGHRKDIEIFLDEHMLIAPLRWRRPRMVFVCSMTDLFASFVPDEWIDRIFAVMALCPQHRFQILTKRTERMREYCKTLGRHHEVDRVSLAMKRLHLETGFGANGATYSLGVDGWHFMNVWLGVSAERQQEADERIPHLLQAPAAVRFVSCEPLLSAIDLSKWLHDRRRESLPSANGPGSIHDRRVGSDMAPREMDWGRRSAPNICDEDESGEEFGRTRKLSSSDVPRRRDKKEDRSSPYNMDDSEPATNPSPDGDQSYRRQEEKQFSGQFGDRNEATERAALSIFPDSEEGRSTGVEKFSGGGERGSGDADQRNVQKSIDDATRDRQIIRNHSGDSLGDCCAEELDARSLDWVIGGGESGPSARPMNPQWARDLRDQCAVAGIPYFHKQNGAWASVSEVEGAGEHYHFPDGRTVRRVGKKAAGRLLDGVEHNGFPRS